LIGVHKNIYVLEMLLVNFNPFENLEFPENLYPVIKFGTGTLERLKPSENVSKAGFNTQTTIYQIIQNLIVFIALMFIVLILTGVVVLILSFMCKK